MSTEDLDRRIMIASRDLDWYLETGKQAEAREAGRKLTALRAQRQMERELAEIDRKARADEPCPEEGE